VKELVNRFKNCRQVARFVKDCLDFLRYQFSEFRDLTVNCTVRRLRAGSKQWPVTGRHRSSEHSKHLRRIELVGRRCC